MAHGSKMLQESFHLLQETMLIFPYLHSDINFILNRRQTLRAGKRVFLFYLSAFDVNVAPKG